VKRHEFPVARAVNICLQSFAAHGFDVKPKTALVPTFRSSCSIAARPFTNFGTSWALANL
jgi:hypothetical protein